MKFPKQATHRDGKYLRLIASLPCFSCGVDGRSQAAHANYGKGMGMKSSDYNTFPLCAPTLGDPGCHARHDQGGLVSKLNRRQLEAFYIQSARKRAKAAGFVFPEGVTDEDASD